MDFLSSNEEGMRGEALYRGADPVARGGGGDMPPLSLAGGATGPPGACRLGPLVGRPRGGRQGPVARWGGRQALSLFSSRDFVANLKKKKIIFEPYRPP